MDINYKGEFTSIEAVWERYPEGGIEGDYLYINSVKYRWNKYDCIWENAETVTDSPARRIDNFDGDVHVQNDLVVGGTLRAKKVKQPNCGLFATEAALNTAFPKPEVGMWAAVGDTLPADIYRCNTEGVWEATGEVGPTDTREYGNVLSYKSAESTGELPFSPTADEKRTGYLIGSKLYVWVGTGGDVLDGKYKDCGEFKGPRGNSGVASSDGIESWTNLDDPEDIPEDTEQLVNVAGAKVAAIMFANRKISDISLSADGKKITIQKTDGNEVEFRGGGDTGNLDKKIGAVETISTVHPDVTTTGGWYLGEIGSTATFVSNANGGYKRVEISSSVAFIDYYCRQNSADSQTPPRTPPYYILFVDENDKILGTGAPAQPTAGYNTYTNIEVPTGTDAVIMMDWYGVRTGKLTTKIYNDLASQIAPVHKLDGETKCVHLLLRYSTSGTLAGKYTSGNGKLITLSQGNVGDIITVYSPNSSVNAFFTNVVPVSEETAVMVGDFLKTSRKNNVYNIRVPAFNGNTLYFFVSGVDEPFVKFNGVDIETVPYQSYDEMKRIVGSYVDANRRDINDLTLRAGAISSADTKAAHFVSYISGRFLIRYGEDYYIRKLKHIAADGTDISSAVGAAIESRPDTQLHFYAEDSPGLVDIEFARLDGEDITDGELSSIITFSQFYDDSMISVWEQGKHIDTINPTIGNTFPLVMPDVKAFVNEVDYTGVPYTTSYVQNYYGVYYYERHLPVRISWPKIDNVLKYQIQIGQISGGSILPAATSTLYETKENSFDLYNLIPGTSYGYFIHAITLDGRILNFSYGNFTTDSFPLRIINLPNVANARDLGGWSAADNKKVRYGLLYRSAALSDFRGYLINDEGKEWACRILGITHEIGLGNNYDYCPLSANTTMVDLPVSPYYKGVTESTENYANILHTIVEAFRNGEYDPATGETVGGVCIFHCAGGCDRTGTLSWLLLGLLGVSESDLSKEYEITSFEFRLNRRLRPQLEEMVDYVKTFTGDTLKDKIESWFMSIGDAAMQTRTAADIVTFRERMLV